MRMTMKMENEGREEGREEEEEELWKTTMLGYDYRGVVGRERRGMALPYFL